MARKVLLDENECIGCGVCEELCPEVFHLDLATSKAEVIQEEGGPEDQIQEAIDNCPVECIHWEG
ncbi:MAG: ferredoxin [Desulfovibrionales bacterium]|nr:MAG: ferredoxin [Desulfovibrionales bacterium]